MAAARKLGSSSPSAGCYQAQDPARMGVVLDPASKKRATQEEGVEKESRKAHVRGARAHSSDSMAKKEKDERR